MWGIINRFGGVGYANGYKSKKVDTPAVTLSVSVPKATDQLEVCGQPFFPQSLERGWRSSRTVIRAVAEMYVKGSQLAMPKPP